MLAIIMLFILTSPPPPTHTPAPIIPTQTAIIVLAAIAAVYFTVTGLCVVIVVLIVCSSNKGRRFRVRPALRYSMRGKKGETHQLQPISRRSEPLPDARLSTSEKGIIFRSVSREFMREDGGTITYT